MGKPCRVRKPLRADAARNRARLLEVAYRAFADEGLGVPVDEIARSAGVGAGTLYRHFPTKEALFEAVVEDRVRLLVEHMHELSAGREPGDAFIAVFNALVEQAAFDKGLVDAMAGTGFDIKASVPSAEATFMTAFDDLLTAAKKDGAIRSDVDVHEVKTLLVGCQAMQASQPDQAIVRTAVDVVLAGLRPRPA